MLLPEKKLYTIDDIYALPEGKRAELINGIMYDLAAPSREHQKLVHFFDRIIGNHIIDSGMPCEVYPAPFAVFLHDDDATYVEPDLSIICDSNKLRPDGCHGAPDWIIEVVSPKSKNMDYLRKLLLYQRAGVKLYWIVDPADHTVAVYDFEAEMMERYSFSDQIPVSICEGFTIQIGDC